MIVKYKNSDTGAEFSASGTNLPVVKDVGIILHGEWEENKRYGKNFHVVSYDILLPTTLIGFVNYISALRCHIGKSRAKAIFCKFGKDAWEMLESNPDAVATAAGIPSSNIELLNEKLKSTRIEQELARLCAGVIEINGKKAKAVSDRFGAEAMEILRANPYRLC